MRNLRWFCLVPAAFLVIAGCSSSHKAAVTTTPSTTSSTSSTVATGSSTTAPTATTPTTVSAGGPLPLGFTVTDLTWVSDNQGWALGTAPCTHAPCTSVVHTLNGGQSWAGLPAPKAYLTSDEATSGAPACSAKVPCVSGIRFANANVGYTYGLTSMWLTTNGGHTWTERGTDPTDALEVDGSTVIRVTHSANQSPPGIPYTVQATTVGSTTWHTVSAPALNGDGAALSVQGANLYVAVFENPAGGAQDEHTLFARSTDTGAHWSTFADPCGVTSSGSEADASAIAAAPGGFLVVGCTARQAGETGFVVESTNAGATFGPHRGGLVSPVPADGVGVVKVAAATGQRIVVLGVSDSTAYISVSNDSGVDWTVTQTAADPSAGPNNQYLGFEDATTGRAVIRSQTILTTTDGGGHWTPFTFL